MALETLERKNIAISCCSFTSSAPKREKTFLKFEMGEEKKLETNCQYYQKKSKKDYRKFSILSTRRQKFSPVGRFLACKIAIHGT